MIVRVCLYLHSCHWKCFSQSGTMLRAKVLSTVEMTEPWAGSHGADSSEVLAFGEGPFGKTRELHTHGEAQAESVYAVQGMRPHMVGLHCRRLACWPGVCELWQLWANEFDKLVLATGPLVYFRITAPPFLGHGLVIDLCPEHSCAFRGFWQWIAFSCCLARLFHGYSGFALCFWQSLA